MGFWSTNDSRTCSNSPSLKVYLQKKGLKKVKQVEEQKLCSKVDL
jgi:hypothetical protein